MNKKIVTFTMSLRQSQFEVDRLETEAKKLGVGVNRSLYRELTFDLNNENPKVLVRGEELTPENTLGMWFRVAGTVSGKYTEGRNLLIKLIHFVYFMDCFEGIIISLCNESVLTPWYRVSYLFNNNTELLRRLVIIENQK